MRHWFAVWPHSRCARHSPDWKMGGHRFARCHTIYGGLVHTRRESRRWMDSSVARSLLHENGTLSIKGVHKTKRDSGRRPIHPCFPPWLLASSQTPYMIKSSIDVSASAKANAGEKGHFSIYFDASRRRVCARRRNFIHNK